MAAAGDVSRLISRIHSDEEDLDDEISASEDEEVENGDEKHKNLLKAIGSLDQNGKKRKKKIPQRSEPHQKASEFHLGSTGGDSEKVQLHELIGSLSNTSSHGAIKKKLESMQQKTEVLDVPLSKPQAERIQRTIAYEEVSKDMNKWASTVQKNREAEHLSFPLNQDQPQRLSTKSLTVNFKPTTPLEQEIAAVLRGSSHVLERPNHELTLEEEEALKAMDLDEAQDRLKELQKLRALQSYYESKCRRNKKIKSKKYHRIKRKAEERAISKLSLEELEKQDPEKFRQEVEKLEKIRVLERMSLKHRNTSKWAKQLMIKGVKDKEARKALSEQLKLSRQLTEKKIDSDSDEDEEDVKEMEEDGPPVSILVGASDNPWMMDDNEDDTKATQQPNEQSGKVKRLQPITAKDTHEDKELMNDSDDEEQKIDDEFELLRVIEDKVKEKKKKEKKVKRKKGNDIKEIENEQNSSVDVAEEEDAKTKKIEVEIVEENDGKRKGKKRGNSDQEKERKQKKKGKKKKTEKLEVEEDMDSGAEGAENEIDEMETEKESEVEKQDTIAENVVELPTPVQERKTPNTNRKSKQSGKNDVKIDPKKIFRIEDHGPKFNLENTNNDSDEDDAQRINILQAFANDDVVEEFIQEKNEVTEASKPKPVDLMLPGWGDWGGVGVKVSEKKRRKFIIPAARGPPRKDRKIAHVIINEERNKRLAKCQVKDLPHPFTNYAQYERSIRTPIGKHWNTASMTSKLTKPKISTLPGTIIEPIKPNKEVKCWKTSEKQTGRKRNGNTSLVLHD